MVTAVTGGDLKAAEMTFAHHKALFPMNDNDVFVTILVACPPPLPA